MDEMKGKAGEQGLTPRDMAAIAANGRTDVSKLAAKMRAMVKGRASQQVNNAERAKQLEQLRSRLVALASGVRIDGLPR